MKGSLMWFAGAFLGLSALGLMVGAGAGKVSGLLGGVTTVFDHLLSPDYPAIPNLAAKATPTSTSTGGRVSMQATIDAATSGGWLGQLQSAGLNAHVPPTLQTN